MVYKSTNQLDEKLRTTLCNIIVSYIKNISASLTNELCKHISKAIVEVFPTEVAERYYISPVKKTNSKNNKSIISKGKLITMWRNRRFKNNQLLKRIKEETVEKLDSDQTENLEFHDEIKECAEWVKNNIAPWGDVLEKWHKTHKMIMNDIADLQERNLTQIFDNWSLFKHPQGHELINIDFKNMNIAKIELNFNLWMEFFEVVQEVQTINTKDSNVHIMIQELSLKDVTEDNKAVKILHLLPHFVPPKRSLGKKKFRPSIAIAQESMIKHVNTPADVTRVRLETKTFVATLKLTVQPYIITVGPNDTVKEIYVCIDETLYTVNSVIKALDICFKAFHVFQLNYPVASEHLWILIQKGIYNFDTKWDTGIPFIAHILNRIKVKLHGEKDSIKNLADDQEESISIESENSKE
ncbi:hypothetical protein ALC57_05488 [Trachymyrmex cornetzi]|uniref:Uncharacterized protein n=3 Tax=Trachymyrmex cornetzi TaxID=471704 RepID=A0A151JAS9_9HYME|nr:hypothetical protein ALC57_05488 [Trachymyrmex cornetzi]